MLPKQNRLKRKKDFEVIFKKGTIYKNKFLVLRILKNNVKVCRIAVIISQKVSKKAVERNKIRRRIYSIAKPVILNQKNNLDFVFSVLPLLKDLNFEELKKQVLSLFLKTNV